MKREREKIYIYGKHALMEALGNAPRAVKKVFLSPEANTSELRGALEKNKIPFSAMKGGDAGGWFQRRVAPGSDCHGGPSGDSRKFR